MGGPCGSTSIVTATNKRRQATLASGAAPGDNRRSRPAPARAEREQGARDENQTIRADATRLADGRPPAGRLPGRREYSAGRQGERPGSSTRGGAGGCSGSRFRAGRPGRGWPGGRGDGERTGGAARARRGEDGRYDGLRQRAGDDRRGEGLLSG